MNTTEKIPQHMPTFVVVASGFAASNPCTQLYQIFRWNADRQAYEPARHDGPNDPVAYETARARCDEMNRRAS